MDPPSHKARPPQFSLGQLWLAVTALALVLGLPQVTPDLSLIFTAICLSALNTLQVARTTPLRACFPGILGWIAGWLVGGLVLGILDPAGVRYFLADPAVIAVSCALIGMVTCPLGAAIGFAVGTLREEIASQQRAASWLKAHRCPQRLRLMRVRSAGSILRAKVGAAGRRVRRLAFDAAIDPRYSRR
jgi:hypothetical protein